MTPSMHELIFLSVAYILLMYSILTMTHSQQMMEEKKMLLSNKSHVFKLKAAYLDSALW